MNEFASSFRFRKKSKGPNKRKKARAKRKLRCRFCTPEGCPRPVYVDYKDLRTLKIMINREGNMISRRRTGNCAKYQRAVRHAILRARFMALLPYVVSE
ncbi:MAG: 30S ribosomal protein S18 [Planctomycetaceae bacterium]|nr:30S ribosomal protein S18 [Planctomycetaceae bacterium]MCA9096810.1 30S ribosomal protein S18 [Planctomycetaceae bacterium]